MNYPIYRIYRSKAALRFTLSRTNSAFIEAAPTIPGREQQQVQKGERKYDWQNQKLSMAVSSEELLAIAAACESLRVKGTSPLPPLYHDPKKGNYNGNPKQFRIDPYTNQTSKTPFIAIANLSETEMGKQTRRFSIGLTYANLYAIQVFATRAASIMLDWNSPYSEKEEVTPEKDETPQPEKTPEPEEEIIQEEEEISENDIPF